MQRNSENKTQTETTSSVLDFIPAPVSLALRGGRAPQIIKEEALRFGKNSAVSDSLTTDGPTFLLHTERSDSGLEVSSYTDLHRAN